MKIVELRRHTANDGDALTPAGILAALELGAGLAHDYDMMVSSGAQRATQTIACILAALGRPVRGGVLVDTDLRSEVEERWFEIARESGGGSLEIFRAADRDLVDAEAARYAGAVRRVLDALPDPGRALVVGHSPMHECAVYGLTGTVVDPIPKGGGIAILADGEEIRCEPL